MSLTFNFEVIQISAFYDFQAVFCSGMLHILQTWRNTSILGRIWGSHGGEYEDGCLLGCSAV
jgi:hypothetical protein